MSKKEKALKIYKLLLTADERTVEMVYRIAMSVVYGVPERAEVKKKK